MFSGKFFQTRFAGLSFVTAAVCYSGGQLLDEAPPMDLLVEISMVPYLQVLP